jgi:hypothetical protein
MHMRWFAETIIIIIIKLRYQQLVPEFFHILMCTLKARHFDIYSWINTISQKMLQHPNNKYKPNNSRIITIAFVHTRTYVAHFFRPACYLNCETKRAGRAYIIRVECFFLPLFAAIKYEKSINSGQNKNRLKLSYKCDIYSYSTYSNTYSWGSI